MDRHLYRSRREHVVAGVAGGLGEYLGIDPVIVRLFFIIFTLATPGGWGLLLYIVLWIAVPEAPPLAGAAEPEPAGSYHRLDSRERGLLLGGALVVLGFFLLFNELRLWWWVSLRHFWPVLLIAAGLALLIDRTRSAR